LSFDIGCEAWCIILKEEHRWRLFKNRMLKSVFESKRGVTGEWRKLHNEELYNSSPNIMKVIRSRSMKREVRVTCMGR
jgi:hypothetical protein